MDTSWWLALVAVMLLGLVATLVDGWGRGHRRTPRRAGRPRPAEIWWADVGSGARPCLVLGVRGRRVTVVRITSRDHGERAGVIALPPGSVGDARGRPSFLETDDVRHVSLADFRRRVGMVDPVLWDQVRHLAG